MAMSEQTHEIRSVAWSEVFPWLMLLRALRLATSAPLLLAATVGVLLMPQGWHAAALLLGEPAGQSVAQWPVNDVTEAAASGLPFEIASPPQLTWPRSWREFTAPMLGVLPGGVQPVRHVFRIDASWRELGYFALGTLWNIVVWAFFGAIIVRTAVMQFGREERVGLVDAGRFAARRYSAFVGAPLFPLALTVVIVLFSIPVGWLLRFDVGVLLAAFVWVFVLLGGLLAAVALIGLLFGWPLMWAALSTEEMGDVFEATQRSFSYTFGRPLHYAWYALIALIIGSAACVLVQWMAELVVYLSFWLVSWGSGSESLQALPGADAWRFAGVGIIAWLSQLVLTVASSFRYAFFWCAAGAIYLLLRRDSDQIEFDVVHVPDQQVRYSLPPLTTDEAGVPGVADD
jgi:hypothetical protein